MVASRRAKLKRLNLMKRFNRPSYFGYAIHRLEQELYPDAQVTEQTSAGPEKESIHIHTHINVLEQVIRSPGKELINAPTGP